MYKFIDMYEFMIVEIKVTAIIYLKNKECKSWQFNSIINIIVRIKKIKISKLFWFYAINTII